MKMTKLLLNRSTGTAVAFAIGVVSVFAFKPATSSRSLKNTVTRFTLDNSTPKKCISTLCTNTNTSIPCGVNAVYQNNTCTTPETVFIWHP